MMKGNAMNIHEAQMYVSLCSAARDHADLFNEPTHQALERIAINRHCGNGYYSWDGMLDDLAMLTGSEEIASEILNNC
jgi:hypothetical protein